MRVEQGFAGASERHDVARPIAIGQRLSREQALVREVPPVAMGGVLGLPSPTPGLPT